MSIHEEVVEDDDEDMDNRNLMADEAPIEDLYKCNAPHFICGIQVEVPCCCNDGCAHRTSYAED